MPEGDTVWRTAQRLNEALAGDPLVHADLRWPSLALADLRGAVTLEIRARGKHLLHRLDNGLFPALAPADGGPVAGQIDGHPQRAPIGRRRSGPF